MFELGLGYRVLQFEHSTRSGPYRSAYRDDFTEFDS